jgi:hypothetical protein
MAVASALPFGGRDERGHSASRPAPPIGRANLDGTHVNQSFIKGANNPAGVAVDAAHIYWTNSGAYQTGKPTTIGRANLNGTGVNERFITGTNGSCGLALAGGHIYWANNNSTTIGRANLNGTGVNESFITGANGPCGVAVG